MSGAWHQGVLPMSGAWHQVASKDATLKWRRLIGLVAPDDLSENSNPVSRRGQTNATVNRGRERGHRLLTLLLITYLVVVVAGASNARRSTAPKSNGSRKSGEPESLRTFMLLLNISKVNFQNAVHL
ncbi:hypothetical protein RRG08_025117 [Elysia crispata]|uniref:Uncharacterized protein n=1 Tax=Elysia crispata TaxID=231223 RepID=A0AAE1AIP0_9GAST|nr:hypothetical protein RRG08_025117 [Elysia crispata]